MNGKFTIGELKSFRLSYKLIIGFTFVLNLTNISGYEAAVEMSVITLVPNAGG